MKKIDLTSLPPENLIELQKNLKSELEHFNASLQALSTASQKFKECINNIQQLSNVGFADKGILVPLSPSLYIPGKVKDGQRFMVDIGTGYYIEKNAEQSVEFYNKRISKLKENSEQLNKTIQEKYDLLNKVQQVLNIRVQELQQQQLHL
ncbi:hypothetical protein PACTADRAFT_46040 [Pachysolen tannophilus NRRL Y-2460]|uniref:Prefoldin, alpha subunit n=1 Tax=Pachysolen tannophilus NRRL Y-2460 TaxID=669874 RepID=A0A1E4TQJ4_PACTA|nr:hypothetical protein PACTADRAFT_46040 [Pachysolen tannophilus NRRL Y-2460]